jgi:hypothetical protein
MLPLGADAQQAADVMPLEQPVQAGTGQMRDRGLEGIEAVIEWHQRMSQGDCI